MGLTAFQRLRAQVDLILTVIRAVPGLRRKKEKKKMRKKEKKRKSDMM